MKSDARLTHVSSPVCGKGNGMAAASVAKDAPIAIMPETGNCMAVG